MAGDAARDPGAGAEGDPEPVKPRSSGTRPRQSRQVQRSGIRLQPFRWNVAKREQLGRLVDNNEPETDQKFLADLRAVSAKIIARAGDSNLVFVGRSPEHMFDYLSGVFCDIPSPPPMTLLQFSAPRHAFDTLVRWHAKDLEALFDYFSAEQLDPASIARGGTQVRFIDLVFAGNTFAALFSLMKHWCLSKGEEWNVVRKRIGFIGITSRTKNSPNTWRWHQKAGWVAEIERANIKNISIPAGLWRWAGDYAEKATPSFRIERWAAVEARSPSRSEQHLKGLRLAARLFEHGRRRKERALFASELAAQPEMKEAWLRTLVLRLRSVQR